MSFQKKSNHRQSNHLQLKLLRIYLLLIPERKEEIKGGQIVSNNSTSPAFSPKTESMNYILFNENKTKGKG